MWRVARLPGASDNDNDDDDDVVSQSARKCCKFASVQKCANVQHGAGRGLNSWLDSPGSFLAIIAVDIFIAKLAQSARHTHTHTHTRCTCKCGWDKAIVAAAAAAAVAAINSTCHVDCGATSRVASCIWNCNWRGTQHTRVSLRVCVCVCGTHKLKTYARINNLSVVALLVFQPPSLL